MRSNPEVMEFIPRPLVENQEQALAHLELILGKIEDNTGINWAMTEKGANTMIGIIGLFRIEPENFRAEIGYMLLPQYAGKGYISEAIHAVLAYGFDDMKLHAVEAIIDPENHASARVLEKNGFVREAHFRENLFHNGKFLDAVHYGILSREFQK